MEDSGMHVRHSLLMRQVTGGLAIDSKDKKFDGAQVLAAVEATQRARSKAARRARSEGGQGGVSTECRHVDRFDFVFEQLAESVNGDASAQLGESSGSSTHELSGPSLCNEQAQARAQAQAQHSPVGGHHEQHHSLSIAEWASVQDANELKGLFHIRLKCE